MRSWLRSLDAANGGFQHSYQAGEGVSQLPHATTIGISHRRDHRGVATSRILSAISVNWGRDKVVDDEGRTMLIKGRRHWRDS